MFFFYLSVITLILRANVFFIKLDPLKTIEIKQDKKKEKEIYSNQLKDKKYNTPRSALIEFLEISKTRWVGIDALIAVEAFDDKSLVF